MAPRLAWHTSARAERPRGAERHSAISTHHNNMLGVALALPAALVLAVTQCQANATSHKHRHPAPVTTSHDIENDTTGTIPSKAPAPSNDAAAPTSKEDEALAPPFHLPAAPRKRMRDCGMKWQAMKMSGQAGDDIWRAFATHCLADAKGPFDGMSSNR